MFADLHRACPLQAFFKVYKLISINLSLSQ